MILGYLAGLATVFIVIRERITRVEVRQDNILERLTIIKSDVDKNKTDIERERRYVLEKLAQIEAGQSRTNIFLEENLKNLTRIITLHEGEIDKLRNKMDKINSK